MHSHSHPEADQHITPTKETKEPFAHYTQEQRDQIDELKRIQLVRKISDSKFGRPCDVSESAWNRAKHGKYGGPFDGDLASIITRLNRNYLPQTRGYIDMDHTAKILEGIDFAREQAARNDEKRGFWLIGETGDGKTTLARIVEREKGGVRIHATPAWTTGYYSILKAVAAKLGIGVKNKSTSELEHDLFAHLNSTPTAKVLVFEEVQQQNARTIKELLSFWMALLNETKAVVLVLTVNEFFKDFKLRGGEYASQFLRRTLVIQCDRVATSHVLQLMPKEWEQNSDLKAGAKAIAEAARKRGGFDLVKEVAALLRAEHATTPSTDEIVTMINHYFDRHQLSAAA